MSAAAIEDLADLQAAVASLPRDRPGIRLRGNEALRLFFAPAGRLAALVTRLASVQAHPVRAILFDKTARSNWSLAWHQDRTICVERRIEAAGFGRWSMKQGMQHVEPPFALLQRMITVRIHLDDVDANNGPLLVAPGSHRFGRVAMREMDDAVARCGVFPCHARAGDVWVHATPILHASPLSTSDERRRVLQVDYSADALPHGLRWLGI